MKNTSLSWTVSEASDLDRQLAQQYLDEKNRRSHRAILARNMMIARLHVVHGAPVAHIEEITRLSRKTIHRILHDFKLNH